MSRILIFCPSVGGHQLEYHHHIYEVASSDTTNDYIFCVSDEFKKVSDNFEWPKRDNISFRFLSVKETEHLYISSILVNSYRSSKLCARIVREVKATRVFYISLMECLPFLPFLLPSKVKCSGIIYKIYLYVFNSESLFRKFQDKLKYYFFSRSKIFDKVLILNDNWATNQLNQIWNSNRFTYIVDPYLPIDINKIHNIREDFSINSSKKIILHCGEHSGRKGTIKLFYLIDEVIMQGKADDFCFIFAGRPVPVFKDRFYTELKKYEGMIQILVFDDFLNYELFGSICNSSDLIVLPYEETCQSSGVIGYAAQFKVPVLMPDGGLIGKLVTEHKIGYTYTPEEFVATFRNIVSNSIPKISSNYTDTHTSEDFKKVLTALFSNNNDKTTEIL